ncbi:hypothetical protein BT63DRAFT_459580 [Microthyrium microscopicum]|uniref:BTB domain-containing protein n=1 Tax=Microthyrium microscopicum TaxID=703497 RepID=A0A6A6U123_9PEZI|nr:hypothetical protein BT63DRAFT_459580 [Microthyrium microscopicum]
MSEIRVSQAYTIPRDTGGDVILLLNMDCLLEGLFIWESDTSDTSAISHLSETTDTSGVTQTSEKPETQGPIQIPPMLLVDSKVLKRTSEYFRRYLDGGVAKRWKPAQVVSAAEVDPALPVPLLTTMPVISCLDVPFDALILFMQILHGYVDLKCQHFRITGQLLFEVVELADYYIALPSLQRSGQLQLLFDDIVQWLNLYSNDLHTQLFYGLALPDSAPNAGMLSLPLRAMEDPYWVTNDFDTFAWLFAAAWSLGDKNHLKDFAIALLWSAKDNIGTILKHSTRESYVTKPKVMETAMWHALAYIQDEARQIFDEKGLEGNIFPIQHRFHHLNEYKYGVKFLRPRNKRDYNKAHWEEMDESKSGELSQKAKMAYLLINARITELLQSPRFLDIAEGEEDYRPVTD